MAIQLPNPGLGDGQTGDNEFVMWTKVKDNFSNTTHAASRLVGTGAGQIPLSEQAMKAAFSPSGVVMDSTTTDIPSSGRHGVTRYSALTSGPFGTPRASIIEIPTLNTGAANLQIAVPWASSQGEYHVYIRYADVSRATPTLWGRIYTSANTTIEENTNYLKVSSPVLRLKHDDFEKEHEAEQMNIEVTNPNTGVYKVTGTTGLRSDGWYFSPPKDEHNNVLCMVEVEEEGGIVTVKTYKKKFDFETVSIVPDYEQPTDIPGGAVVMLRFNDLP